MFETIFYGTSFGRDRLSPARIAYLLLIWVVLPMWLVIGFYTMILGLAFTAVLAMASEKTDADVTFRQPFFTWTGDIGLRDLRIEPRGEQPNRHPILVKKLLIDMPSWGVLPGVLGAFASANGSEQDAKNNSFAFIDKIDHVGMSVEGMQADFESHLPEELKYFGLASAAPFEAEGCKRDGRWIGAELGNMGMEYLGVDLQFSLSTHPQEREVHFEGKLDSPGSSRVRFERHYRAANLSSLLQGEKKDMITTYDRTEVSDAGFIKARNAFCAKRDGVTPEEFTERNVNAIRRRLQSMGVRATTEVESAYRAYLMNGSLLIEAKPSTNVRRADYHYYEVADQMRMFNGRISSGGKPPVLFMLEATSARPIPNSFVGSTWDYMEREAQAAGANALAAAAATGALTAAVPALSAAASPASALTMTMGANAASGSTTIALAAGTAAASASALAQPATPAAAPAPPPAAARASAAAAPSAKRYASSLPSSAARHEITTLAFDDVASHIGERMLITTIYGDKREGRIESFSKQQIGLKVSVGVGYAIQHLERKQIRSIRDLD